MASPCWLAISFNTFTSQYGARLIDQQHTCLGEQHFTAGTLQQHNAQLIFQLADLSAQR